MTDVQVFLTPTHLGIVLQYAAGGELFERVKQAGHFSEDEARYFFQQLITGVRYCHRKNFAHRDLKLENTLLDSSPAPLLKIADFGYCKDLVFDTPPKSTVGTPAYISPVRIYTLPRESSPGLDRGHRSRERLLWRHVPAHEAFMATRAAMLPISQVNTQALRVMAVLHRVVHWSMW